MRQTSGLLFFAVATIAVILGAGSATAQTLDNSCTYSFSFGSDYNYFSFCLTKYGTLAKIESPKGKSHLDSSNPIEGFAWCDTDGWDFNHFDTVIPGLGFGPSEPPTVTQPNGPGKLPITFWGYPRIDALTVTAVPTEKTIVMTFKLPKLIYDDKYQHRSGGLTRMANVRLDNGASSNFASSSNAGLSFNPTGSGLLLGGTFQGNVFGSKFLDGGFGGINLGITVNNGKACFQSSEAPFVGQGAVFNIVGYELANPGKAVFEYKVF